MDKETLLAIAEQLKPDLVGHFKERLTNSVEWEVERLVLEEITEHVKKWTKNEIIPELEKSLIENKDGLIKLAIKAAEVIVEDLGVGLAETLKKNLESQWTRNEIFKKMFS